MASFSGTLDKCKVCDKKVYVVDLLSSDGVTYHKSCFRCSHCNGMLVMSNYSSIEGVLYCKPHFEQLFKETGSYNKIQTPSKTTDKSLTRTPSKFSSMFSGTQDKCTKCNKTVYPLEKVTVESVCYHKACFRCAHGGCHLTTSNYAALDGIMYCKPHFSQLFKAKGDYSQLLKTPSMKKSEEAGTEPAIQEQNSGEADS